MEKAVIVFSGGQDSVTCLGWAMNRFSTVEAITFNYGQKHAIEIEQSRKVCEKFGIRQTIIDISFLNTIVDSALTSGGDVNGSHPRLKSLPASFVPNRNQLFLTLAHAYAQKIGAGVLITGVCEADGSGYPDCRLEFIQSIQNSSNLGSEANIQIKTPLISLNKAGIFNLADEEGVLGEVIELSHTCYNGDRTQRHDWGYGCGECPACKLRKRGWGEFKKS